MPKKTARDPADFILPLYINGLEGRMLKVPAPSGKKREILFVYGHHAMLERWWGLIENLNQYGAVTMPDLPGFGGMQSLEKIGVKPSVDAYADYLASFIKLRYRNKRLSIFALSYGFVVVTRMLQLYPELAKKVDILVSMVGFLHRDDFVYSKRFRLFARLCARLFATRPIALFIRHIILNRPVIKTIYVRLPNAKKRMIEITPEEFEMSMDFEAKLWRVNDVRTHWLTTSEFLGLDNTKLPVRLPVIHVASKYEHYFNNTSVEQHMRAVFTDYKKFTVNTKSHTPSILANKKAMSVLLPPGLRKILAKK